jgi:hypothetical protein
MTRRWRFFGEYRHREPEDRDADFVIGRLLLERDDPEGIGFMERAAEQFTHALDACEHVYAFHRRRDDQEAANVWRLRGEQQIDLESRARAERASLGKKDVFLASELPESWIVHLREQLEAAGNVRHAWIARKRVAIAPEVPLYVLAFAPNGWFKNKEKLAHQLADSIEVPGECFFVVRGGNATASAKKVEKTGQRIL